MRGVGVLVGVAVSGAAGAWVTKLVVGSVTAPLFFFGAEKAPTLTPHWKLVLVGGGLLEALVAALLLVVLLPSLSGYRIDVGPGFAAMLIGNMVAGLALLIIGEARIHASAAYLPTSTATISIGIALVPTEARSAGTSPSAPSAAG